MARRETRDLPRASLSPYRRLKPRRRAPGPTNGGPIRDAVLNAVSGGPGIIDRMAQPTPELIVEPDAFRVARGPAMLAAELRAAVAVCVYDDTQGVGGLLHLRYVATQGDQPVDLTDNTLSSDLLLMDRFCKDLRSVGARKQSWRVNIFGHTPDAPGMEKPAATVIDLVKAYFSEGRRPVECREFRRALGLLVRLDAREGRIWMGGTPGTASGAKLAALLSA